MNKSLLDWEAYVLSRTNAHRVAMYKMAVKQAELISKFDRMNACTILLAMTPIYPQPINKEALNVSTD